jgi:cell shape-determining protein MreC
VSSSQDDPILKALEETSDRLKKAEAENEILRAKLGLKDELIAIKDDQLKVRLEQVDFFKAAVTKTTEIEGKYGLQVETLRVQHNADLAEINRLERENDKLRSSRNFRTILGFGAGLGTGYVLKK